MELSKESFHRKLKYVLLIQELLREFQCSQMVAFAPLRATGAEQT